MPAPDDKAARATAPVEARIPEGPVPVALPALAELGRRVSAAKAFVTIDKDGARTAGLLAAGPAPYAGKPASDAPLDEMLFAAAGAAAAAAPAAAVALPPSGVDAGVAEAQKGPKAQAAANESTARQRALEAARNAGVLSTQGGESIASLFEEVDSETLSALTGEAPRADSGAPRAGQGGVRLAGLLQVQGALHAGGELDALILADAASSAIDAIEVLVALRARTTSIAVAGQGAPDAVPYRFSPVASAPAETGVRVALGLREARVRDGRGGAAKSVPFFDGVIARDLLVAALREAQGSSAAGPLRLFLDGSATAQQLVDVLGAMASAGVAGVRIIALPPSGGGGGGVGAAVGEGWGVIGTLSTDGAATSKISAGEPVVTGAFDPQIVVRVLRRKLGKIEACYTKRLAVVPTLAGTVATRFALSPQGKVSSASATGVDPEVASCVAGVIEGVQFPAPKAAGVQVAMPFTFQPTATP